MPVSARCHTAPKLELRGVSGSSYLVILTEMKEIVLDGVPTAVMLERYPAVLPSEAQVQEFEQALGYSLPTDYRAFLLAYNGGITDVERVIPSIDVCICDLFGLYPGGPNERMQPLQLPASPELRELWGELPANLLPIGDTDGGDMLAIRFLPAGSEVVILDHETNALRQMLRADTFTALLVSSRPLDEEDGDGDEE